MDILIAYDIVTVSRKGARRLAQVAGVCERYGTRVQYSLFECHVDSMMLERLKGELLDIINPDEDRIDIYRLDRAASEVRISLGHTTRERLGGAWIISSPNRQ